MKSFLAFFIYLFSFFSRLEMQEGDWLITWNWIFQNEVSHEVFSETRFSHSAAFIFAFQPTNLPPYDLTNKTLWLKVSNVISIKTSDS